MKPPLNAEVIYFLGIGGIGMSALARYFHANGRTVMGYDRTSTALTTELEMEGIPVHFDDTILEIPQIIKLTPKEKVLVVLTPAIPPDHEEWRWFREHGYTILKRSQVLGLITESSDTIAVAGTHGKTTTSTLIAHMLHGSGEGCNAFLGGISANYRTNLLLSPSSNRVVVEADEYDRSFLTLTPSTAIITSMDADHLDIYGKASDVVEGFNLFSKKIRMGGKLILRSGLPLDSGFSSDRPDIALYTYAADDEADFYATRIRTLDGQFYFDLETPSGRFEDLTLGIPGRHNIENATAAAACWLLNGLPTDKLRGVLASFRGVHRRFEYIIKRPDRVFIDDYAHHPRELAACISAARELYPGRKITGIFQPHLYTRTRDFAAEFGQSLALLDDIILLPIYPARELPIPGVDSHMLLDKIPSSSKSVLEKDEILEEIRRRAPEVLLTLGAGDIDTLVDPLRNILE